MPVLDFPQQQATWFNIRAAAAGAEIVIYDEIGSNGVGAKQFIDSLRAHGKAPSLTVRINSPGGSAFDGFAIYNALARHPARKTVWVDGIAASAASVIAMAGNTIRMPGNALLMLHNAHGACIGRACDMRAMAEALARVDLGLITAYRRSRKPDDVIAKWLDSETWFTAKEAVAAGLADRVEKPVAIAASYDLGKFGYRHSPKPDASAAWDKVISAKFAKAGA